MLTISFPREDLIAGSGSVTVSNSADGTSQTIAMNDSSKVTVEPMTESELSKLGWTSGYQAKVLLDEVLAADAQYYVTLFHRMHLRRRTVSARLRLRMAQAGRFRLLPMALT